MNEVYANFSLPNRARRESVAPSLVYSSPVGLLRMDPKLFLTRIVALDKLRTTYLDKIHGYYFTKLTRIQIPQQQEKVWTAFKHTLFPLTFKNTYKYPKVPYKSDGSINKNMVNWLKIIKTILFLYFSSFPYLSSIAHFILSLKSYCCTYTLSGTVRFAGTLFC